MKCSFDSMQEFATKYRSDRLLLARNFHFDGWLQTLHNQPIWTRCKQEIKFDNYVKWIMRFLFVSFLLFGARFGWFIRVVDVIYKAQRVYYTVNVSEGQMCQPYCLYRTGSWMEGVINISSVALSCVLLKNTMYVRVCNMLLCVCVCLHVMVLMRRHGVFQWIFEHSIGVLIFAGA